MCLWIYDIQEKKYLDCRNTRALGFFSDEGNGSPESKLVLRGLPPC
jgi:hypothetical protein